MKTWEHRLWLLVIIVLLVWGVHWGSVVVPQIRSTANQVANLNQLHELGIKGKIGGCIPVDINGTI